MLLMMIVVQKNLNEFDNNWKEHLALLFLPSTRIECLVHLLVATSPLKVEKILVPSTIRRFQSSSSRSRVERAAVTVDY
jgi:hypothetical protein